MQHTSNVHFGDPTSLNLLSWAIFTNGFAVLEAAQIEGTWGDIGKLSILSAHNQSWMGPNKNPFSRLGPWVGFFKFYTLVLKCIVFLTSLFPFSYACLNKELELTYSRMSIHTKVAQLSSTRKGCYNGHGKGAHWVVEAWFITWATKAAV